MGIYLYVHTYHIDIWSGRSPPSWVILGTRVFSARYENQESTGSRNIGSGIIPTLWPKKSWSQAPSLNSSSIGRSEIVRTGWTKRQSSELFLQSVAILTCEFSVTDNANPIAARDVSKLRNLSGNRMNFRILNFETPTYYSLSTEGLEERWISLLGVPQNEVRSLDPRVVGRSPQFKICRTYVAFLPDNSITLDCAMRFTLKYFLEIRNSTGSIYS